MPRVHNYGHHPPLRFLDLGRDPIPGSGQISPDGKKYIGVELEVESIGSGYRDAYVVADSVPAHFQENLEFFLKEDGSLRNGFEIVTHPRTMRMFHAQKEQWGEFFQYLISNKMRSYDSGRCGLHMHLSLNHFDGVSHAMRMLAFFSQNPAFSLALSRRTESSLSNYAQIPNLETVTDCRYATSFSEITSERGYGDPSAPTRHSIGHISRYNTLELRLFRGTLNLESFYAYLDLAQAVIEWTQKHMDFDAYDVEKFIEFCIKPYPNVARVAAIAHKRSKTKKYAAFDFMWKSRRPVSERALNPTLLASGFSVNRRQSHKHRRMALTGATRAIEQLPCPWWIRPMWWELARKMEAPTPGAPVQDRYAFAIAGLLYRKILGERGSVHYQAYREKLIDLGVSEYQDSMRFYIQTVQDIHIDDLVKNAKFEVSSGILIARGDDDCEQSYFRPAQREGLPWRGPTTPSTSIMGVDELLGEHNLWTIHCTIFTDDVNQIQIGWPLEYTWMPRYFENHMPSPYFDSNFVVLPTTLMSAEYIALVENTCRVGE